MSSLHKNGRIKICWHQKDALKIEFVDEKGNKISLWMHSVWCFVFCLFLHYSVSIGFLHFGLFWNWNLGIKDRRQNETCVGFIIEWRNYLFKKINNKWNTKFLPFSGEHRSDRHVEYDSNSISLRTQRANTVSRAVSPGISIG